MKKRILGKSGMEVSELGFGCMSLEGSQKEISDLIHRAIDHDITLFDTADMYDQGENEIWLGKALKGKRDGVVVATKVGHVWDEEGYKWAPTYDRVIQGCNNSLKRLQTDYIDLYQLHGGTLEDPVDDLIKAMEELKRAGKIRAWGVSSIRPNVIREYLSKADPASFMMQYSLLDRRPEEECLDLLKEHETGLLARGPIAKGLLAGKSPRNYLDHSKKEVSKIQSLLRSHGDPLAIALGFLSYNDTVTSYVAGIRTQDQLHEIISAVQQIPEPKLIQKIHKLIPSYKYTKHR